MSANFIFITKTYSDVVNKVHVEMQKLVKDSGEGKLWIEQCSFLTGFCALHFSSKNIEYFDAILQVSDSLGLNPFPNYDMLGLSTCCISNAPLSGPFGINRPPNADQEIGIGGQERIKVGVIEFGFNEHINLPGSTTSGDDIHGTHVAGIIAAIANNANNMRGVCSPDSHVDLRYYTLPRHNINDVNFPNLNDVNFPFFSDLLNVLIRLCNDSVKLVNISMNWHHTIISWGTNQPFIENWLHQLKKIIIDND